MALHPALMSMDPECERFTFAGFSWPRFIATLPHGPLRDRIARRRVRPVCGEAYHAPRPEQAGKGRGFYLDERQHAPAIGRHWYWCEDVSNAIDHRGWYCDEQRDDKMRGIVVGLSHGRFLAGWAMGINMTASVDGTVYTSLDDAARAADEEARIAAEHEREYREQEYARIAAEERETEMMEGD